MGQAFSMTFLGGEMMFKLTLLAMAMSLYYFTQIIN